MENLDDFFSEEPAPQEQEVEIETPVEIGPETEEQASQEAEPNVEVAPEEPRREATMLPLAAVLEERRKAREDRDELMRLRQQMAQYEQSKPDAAAPAMPQGAPDPYDDPAGFYAYQQQQIAEQVQVGIFQNNLQTSRSRAVQKYGQDYINEVADWAGDEATRNPAFESELMRQADPAEWVVEQKKRSELFKQITTDPDAYVRQRAAELGLAMSGVPDTAPLTPATKPNGPKSLVNAKSTNEAVSLKQQAKDDFDAIFGK